MRTVQWARDAAAVWDIATPAHPARLPGVSMAGFRQLSTDGVDLRMVPHPAVTVAIAFGEGPLLIDDSVGGQQRGSVVAGLAPTGLRVRGRDIECLQVRLSPVIAHALLGGTGELAGSVIGLADVWGRDARRTEDRLRAAGSWDERFATVEDALARRLRGRRAADPEVVWAWTQMLRLRGRVRVEDVAAELGWSRKRLWSRFRDQVGITPKRAAQLIRFDHAAHQLASGSSAASVAAATGYVDQSHLHREAMAFAGVSPTAVAAAEWLAVDDRAWPARAFAMRS